MPVTPNALRLASVTMCALLASWVHGQSLSTSGRGFDHNSRFVTTSVFHWYTSTDGQTVSPWLPEEGRENWTGQPEFWKHQIKDMMDANIDILYVHLWRGFDQQRVNLFKALSQLRAEGYDVPKVAPFLDTLLNWVGSPINLAQPTGRDEFVAEYIRFFNQYFAENTDAFAESYLARLDGRVLLNMWHLNSNVIMNAGNLTRAEVENRLSDVFGSRYPVFNEGVYVTGSGSPLAWFDEDAWQFAGTLYYLLTMNHNGRRTATIRGGYWDELVRDPGRFVRRDGGRHYVDAWACLNQLRNGGLVRCPLFPDIGDTGALPIHQVIVESWNEYSEGTGIYAAHTGPPVSPPNGHTDTWSSTNNPREYIDTTAAGAAQFNDTPSHDARFLRHEIPTLMRAGETATVTLVVRNEGDAQWTAVGGYRLGQIPADAVRIAPGRYDLDDTQDEIPKYGGIFRGRPKTFQIQMTAPLSPGLHQTHWRMLREPAEWFGETLTAPIRVEYAGDFDGDADVDQDDFGFFQACIAGPGHQYDDDCEGADFNRDGAVDHADFVVFHSHMSGPNLPPSP